MQTLKTLNNPFFHQGLVLCADDYAQNDAICEGIITLLENTRINAVSALVNTPLWPNTYTALKPFEANSYLGLHLNLTHGKPLSSLWRKHYGHHFPDLTTVLWRCYTGGYAKPVLVAEIMAQITAFGEAMGKHPDFIDGHQHIHQLPGVREVLLELHDRYQWTNFFRNTNNGMRDLFSLRAFPKRQLIALLGGNTFKKQLIRAQIATNTSFSGIYSFTHAANYRQYFKQFLKIYSQQSSFRQGASERAEGVYTQYMTEDEHTQAFSPGAGRGCNTAENSSAKSISAPSGLIMCHPGIPSQDLHDPLRHARPHEFAYFMSADFLDDLKIPLQKAH